MCLHHFSAMNKKLLYYSLQIPTTTIFSPRSNKASSTMTELRELKHIMEVLLEEINRRNLGIERTPLFQLAQNVKYNFYHTEKDKRDEIVFSGEIINLDFSLTKT